ncbi:MAG: UDP-glucuronic acid decarboxylase family protein [Tepidiformaceae bacterium]
MPPEPTSHLFKPLRTLVAGGAGFIGSHLCERLLDSGHEIVCVDNLVTGRLANLALIDQRAGFEFVRHDIVEELPEFGAFDRIYNLASPASPPGYQRFQVETLRVNSEGTRHLLELALKHRGRFLYASTSEAYGDPLEHPQRESYRGNVSSTGPRSMYDEAKRFGEAMVMAHVRTLGTDARIVRIFNTYGPHSDPFDGRIVPNFITQALAGTPLTVYGTGVQTRSLCYVSDLVDGLVRTMESPATTGEVVNLGNPEEHTVIEFARLIIEMTHSNSTLVYTEAAVGDDPQRRCPDISRAVELLGWRPAVSLQDGLARTVKYFVAEVGGLRPRCTALA